MQRWRFTSVVLFLSVLLMAGGVLLSADRVMAAMAIKIGGLVDITGPTSFVGKQYAAGTQDAVNWLNQTQGGINGKEIDYIINDYQYKIPLALARYKQFKARDKVIMISGWGTGDTEAMRPFITKDKMPYVSASYSSHLNDPSQTPYNFFVGTSYSDQMRIALKWFHQDFASNPCYGKRKARVGWLYVDNAYGRAPLPAGAEYLKELGMEFVGAELMGFNDLDATSQVLNMKKRKPDYIFFNITSNAHSVFLKEAKRQKFHAKIVSINWAFDEDIIGLAKGAAEGAMGMGPFAFYGQDVAFMPTIVQWNNDHHGADTYRNVRYVQGWANMLVIFEALRRADQAGKLNGPGIKAALESLRDYNPGGLTAPITFTAEDHRPNTAAKIHIIKGGKIVPHTDYIDVGRRKDWMGH